MNIIATPRKGRYAERQHKDECHIEDTRTPFQHDRDRILHSTAFRRLQYKTQVYVIHEGDLYRTRMTHSLEVAQIARGIAQSLDVDIDLTEAIALAHDLGHAPFGHVGGDVLHNLLKQYDIPFDHNIQTYRIVSALEERYPDFKGLNLTYATREGILRHRTIFDDAGEVLSCFSPAFNKEVAIYWETLQPGIEAQIVNVSDVIAYAAHDIEDALEMGLLSWESLCQLLDIHHIAFFKELMDNTLASCDVVYRHTNPDANDAVAIKLRNRVLSRTVIDVLIRNVVKQTRINISTLSENADNYDCEKIRDCTDPVVTLTTEMQKQVITLVKDILFDKVYHEPRVVIMLEKGRRIIEILFSTFMRNPGALPIRTQSKLSRFFQMCEDKQKSNDGQKILAEVVADYISGMTDKYAMDMYQLLTQAYEKAL